MCKIFISIILTLHIFVAVLPAQQANLVIQSGHTSRIRSVCFSPDGKYVLSSSQDKTNKLWEVATGREIHTFSGGEYELSEAVFSPDGKYIIARNDWGIIKIWEFDTHREVMTIDIKKNYEYGSWVTWESKISISKDGKYITAGIPHENMVGVWEIATGKEIKNFKGHTGFVNVASFSPDARYIASGSRDNTVKVWESAAGAEKMTLTGFTDEVEAVVYSPDGLYIAAAGKDKVIRFFEANTGKLWKTFEGHSGEVNQIKFSPDGKLILSAGGFHDCTVKLWNVATGKLLHSFEIGYADGNHEVHSVDFAPDGRRFVLASNAEIWIGDLQSRQFTQKIKSTRSWASLGKVIAVPQSSQIGVVNHQLKNTEFWDVAIPKINKEFKGTRDSDRDIAILPDAKKLASIGQVSYMNMPLSLLIWDAESSQLLHITENIDELFNTIQWIPNKDQFLVGGYQNNLQLRDAKSGQVLQRFESLDNIKSLSVAPNGNSFVISDGDKLKYWSQEKQKFTDFVFENSSTIEATVYINETQLAITQGQDVKVLALPEGNELAKMEGTNFMNTIAASADGKYIATGNDANEVQLWDVQNRSLKHTFIGHTNAIEHVFFFNQDKQIVSKAHDGLIKLWDVASGREICTFFRDTDNQELLIFTPDGYYMGNRESLSRLLHFVKDNKVYLFDQFDLQYNRPDIILQRIGIAPQKLIESYHKAYKKRLRRHGFNPAKFEKLRSFNVPEIKLTNILQYASKSAQKEFKLDIEAKDNQQILDRLFIWINGVPLYGVKGKDLKLRQSSQIKENSTIILSQGRNIIEVSVLNDKGVESLKERFEVEYTPPISLNPRLYLINIGVSKYANPKMNLNYAAKDAQDIKSSFQKSGTWAGNIITFSLLNEQVTTENILKLKTELQKTKVDDYVIVTFSGHGLLDDSLDYYLATHPINFSKPSEKGLSYEVLENLLDSIPARHKILLLDACHSGEVDKEDGITIPKSDNLTEIKGVVKARNFNSKSEQETTKTTQNKEITMESVDLDFEVSTAELGLPNSFELMRNLFADLRRGSGATVISAAGGAEYALEGADWKNGVFTYALLSGLKDMKADLDKDGKVMLSELKNYVQQTVPALTGGAQQPTSRTENLVKDFRVW
jgi:WD40 repeat protein